MLADDVPQVDGAGVMADAFEAAVGGSAQPAATMVKDTKSKATVKAEPGWKAKKRKMREEESATSVASKKPSVIVADVGSEGESAGAEGKSAEVVCAGAAFPLPEDDAAGGTSA